MVGLNRMVEGDMERVAELIIGALDGEDVLEKVLKFRRNYNVCFC